MKFFVYLIAIALVGSVIFVVGLELLMGSGGDNQQDRPQGSKAEQSKEEQSKEEGSGGEKAKKEEKWEWVAGIVLKAATDKHTVIVKPDNGKRQPYPYKPDEVKVTLDGNEAGPDAIEEGQRISIGYKKVMTNKNREVDVAKSIILASRNGTPSDESTS